MLIFMALALAEDEGLPLLPPPINYSAASFDKAAAAARQGENSILLDFG